MKRIRHGCCGSWTWWSLIEQLDKANQCNSRKSREVLACVPEKNCTIRGYLCCPCFVRSGKGMSRWVFYGGVAEQALRRFDKSFNLVKTLQKIHRAELVAQSLLEPHQRLLSKFQRRHLIEKSDATSSSEAYEELLGEENMNMIKK